MSGPLPRNINTLPAATEANDSDLLILRQFDGVSAWQDKKISIGTIKPLLANVTITTQDTQSVSGVAFEIFGALAYDVPVMDTYLDNDDRITIENRTWDTPFVIDKSAVEGERGTYTDLQTAIDDLVVAGYGTLENPGVIRFRTGQYEFNTPIVLPAGIFLILKGDVNEGIVGNSNFTEVEIKTKITGSDENISLYIYNMTVSTSDDYGIELTGGNLYVSNAQVRDANLTGVFANYSYCSACNITVQSCSLNLSFCGSMYATMADQSTVFASYCNYLTVQQNNATLPSQLILEHCNQVISTGNDLANSSAFYDYCTLGASPLQNEAEALYVGSIVESNATLGPGSGLFDVGIQPRQKRMTKGSVFVSRYVDTDTTLNKFDHFLGIKGNVAPVSVLLPYTSSLEVGIRWQSWVIADLEGTASTNPITLVGEGCLINGQASLVIDQDFGGVQLYFDGTNYYAILSNLYDNSAVFNSLVVNGKTTLNGPQVIKVTEVDDDYNILTSDFAVAVTDTTAPRSLQLPVTGSSENQAWEVKDRSGNASVNAITITAEGGALIDNAASILINDDYQGWSFVFDGTNFWTR